MSGRLWARVAEQAARLGEAAAARRRAALQRELAEVPGVAAVIDSDGVVLSGRGLMRRLADDARLRFVGRDAVGRDAAGRGGS